MQASPKNKSKKEFEILVHFETLSGFTDRFLLFKLPKNFKPFQDDLLSIQEEQDFRRNNSDIKTKKRKKEGKD